MLSDGVVSWGALGRCGWEVSGIGSSGGELSCTPTGCSAVPPGEPRWRRCRIQINGYGELIRSIKQTKSALTEDKPAIHVVIGNVVDVRGPPVVRIVKITCGILTRMIAISQGNMWEERIHPFDKGVLRVLWQSELRSWSDGWHYILGDSEEIGRHR
jgi:hypothetical protein